MANKLIEGLMTAVAGAIFIAFGVVAMLLAMSAALAKHLWPLAIVLIAIRYVGWI